MENVRLGIIGSGNMGNGHFCNVLEGKCPSVAVTAVCDVDPAKLEKVKHSIS